MTKERYNPTTKMGYNNKCRICSYEGKETHHHHIIGKRYSIRTNQGYLVTAKGNIVELCFACHEKTDSYRYRVNAINEERMHKAEEQNTIRRE